MRVFQSLIRDMPFRNFLVSRKGILDKPEFQSLIRDMPFRNFYRHRRIHGRRKFQSLIRGSELIHLCKSAVKVEKIELSLSIFLSSFLS